MNAIMKRVFVIFSLGLLLTWQLSADYPSSPPHIEQARLKEHQVSSVLQRTFNKDGKERKRNIRMIDREGRETHRDWYWIHLDSTKSIDSGSAMFSYEGGLLTRIFEYDAKCCSQRRLDFQYDSRGQMIRRTIFEKEKDSPGWISILEDHWIFDPSGNSVVHIFFFHDPVNKAKASDLTAADTGRVNYNYPSLAVGKTLKVELKAYEYQWDNHLKIQRKIPGMETVDGNPDTVVLFHTVDDGYVSDSGHVLLKYDKRGYFIEEWQGGYLTTAVEYKFNERGLAVEAIYRDEYGYIWNRDTFEYTYY